MAANQSRSSTSSFRSLSSSLRSLRSRVAGSNAPTADAGDGHGPADALTTTVPSSATVPASSPPLQASKASLWKRLRSALRVGFRPSTRRRRAPSPGPVRHDELVAATEGEVDADLGGQRPDDWFYQLEIRESDAARQRRQQRYEEMQARRDAECTFRPAVRYRRRRSGQNFLQRQRQFEDRRASLQEYQRAKQEWVFRDLSKEGHRNKVADPIGVWQRSVDWNNRRLHRRIFRQIDQRIGERSQCPFESVRDWTTPKSTKMDEFQIWKRSVDQSHRSDFYRDLADVIQSISSETMPSH